MVILHKSGENYLKTIYLLHQKYGIVRECDIAESMGFSKASVCHMIKRLSGQGYLTVKKNDVQLSPAGTEMAEIIYRRFLIIRYFLINVLEIDRAIAENEACEIEHIISEDTVSALSNLLIKKGVTSYDLLTSQTVHKRLQ